MLKNIKISGYLSDLVHCECARAFKYNIYSDYHYDEEYDKDYWRYYFNWEINGRWEHSAVLTLEEAYEYLTNIAEYYLKNK